MDKNLWILIFAVVLAAIALFYLSVFIGINSDVEYLKMEMKRSGSEREYRHWRHKLRRLYQENVPVIGQIIAKFIK